MGLIVLTTIGAVTITWWQGVQSPVLSAQRARLAQASDLDRVFTATALATLLKHQYGDSVSEIDLIKVLFNSRKYIEDPRHDFSLLDLTEYVASRGY